MKKRKFEIRFKDMSMYMVGDKVDIDDIGNLHILNTEENTCNLSCNARQWIFVRAVEEIKDDVHQE